MAIFIFGIMLYKFGLEAFVGSIIALATNRYDYEAFLHDKTPRTFERVGLLTGLNQAFQCVGAILIAPLVRGFSTRTVLSSSVLVFGLLTAIMLIMDASTGGISVPKAIREKCPKDDFHYYGTGNTNGVIPVSV
jgi:MFS family permease